MRRAGRVLTQHIRVSQSAAISNWSARLRLPREAAHRLFCSDAESGRGSKGLDPLFGQLFHRSLGPIAQERKDVLGNRGMSSVTQRVMVA